MDGCEQVVRAGLSYHRAGGDEGDLALASTLAGFSPRLTRQANFSAGASVAATTRGRRVGVVTR
jgi:hypothetical protein